ARALGWESPSPLPHPVPVHDLHGHRGMLRDGALAVAAARHVGQHRHAARVRAGVRRGVDITAHASRSGATLSDAPRAAGTAPGHFLLSGPHAHAAPRYVDPTGGVAGDRIRDLLRLQPETQRAAGLDALNAERRRETTSRRGVTENRHGEPSRGTVGSVRFLSSRDSWA